MTKYTIIYYRESEVTASATVVYSGFDKEFAMKVFDYYCRMKGNTTVSEEYITATDALTKL